MSAMIEYTIRGQYPREGLGLTRLWRRLQGKPTFPKADVLMKAIKSAKTDVEVTGVEFDTALQAHLPRDVAAAFRFPRGIKVTDISITSDRGDRAEQILSWVLSADQREASLGDLEEAFQDRLARGVSEKELVWWYHWQVARMCGHFLGQKVLKLIGVAALLHKMGLL
jgi:hypothetical protein